MLFGRAMRLPVLMWIHARADPAFYQGEVHTETGYPQSAIADELSRFADIGLISRTGRIDHGRQYYVRDDASPLWGIVDTARLALETADHGFDEPVREAGNGADDGHDRADGLLL